jgi:hypothetical protein
MSQPYRYLEDEKDNSLLDIQGYIRDNNENLDDLIYESEMMQ